ncbi:hypothetical protein SAMN05444392_11156 [Seinonella peptonophila]|uniref:Uncharacterized protein n=1 Tax=Seinonella peptonophila TaxID=112248 RepID=A0A1M4ZYY6_9BACL|nr:hypothetical protein [Seinonella peptonophila]SHF23218.1 hypothetical protein SAMN05444392_11156 [Seinonella peptonophila]
MTYRQEDWQEIYGEAELYDVPDEIPIKKVSKNRVKRKMIKYLKFGKHKVPMSNQEHQLLEKEYMRFIEEQKTPFGFVMHLIGGEKD